MRLSHTADFVSGHASVGQAHQPWLPKAMILFRRRLEAWATRRRSYRDAQQLDRFSDRELWDLGLSRSDVPAIARGIYKRD
ncbi:MAG: hypothetical protein B7Z80_03540 [Rhodospirillales bacterium 20-64-7]|nr:MAG: hypothetical protein B7Z80_03540 [Rhodospirillales bacterium 20-64-7]HQT75853.1 DUF1127 domain-containing protein [Rhodopila sp.]